MRPSRGYAPRSVSPGQDALLDDILAVAHRAGPTGVGVFDLDGCLFDTRPRQLHILRELGSLEGMSDLYCVTEDHFTDWHLSASLSRAGLPADRVAAILPRVEAHWQPRFFSGEYVGFDAAMPGAAALVWACYRAGMQVVYLTGRHEEMRAGTEAALSRMGFPMQRPGTHLIVKPSMQMEDTAFKREALRELRTLGRPVLFLDNEPSNVNAFRAEEPDALVVFVETDHSPRPIYPLPDIPWIRGFLRQGAPGARSDGER